MFEVADLKMLPHFWPSKDVVFSTLTCFAVTQTVCMSNNPEKDEVTRTYLGLLLGSLCSVPVARSFEVPAMFYSILDSSFPTCPPAPSNVSVHLTPILGSQGQMGNDLAPGGSGGYHLLVVLSSTAF